MRKLDKPIDIAINSEEAVFKHNADEYLGQIEFLISSISKNTVRDETINYFQQSPLHWLFILFVMKYFYQKKDLSKQTLLEEINSHLPVAGKKTVTTEFKYIDEAIAKEYIYAETSQTDHRKKILFPCEATTESFHKWFLNFNSNFIKK